MLTRFEKSGDLFDDARDRHANSANSSKKHVQSKSKPTCEYCGKPMLKKRGYYCKNGCKKSKK